MDVLTLARGKVKAGPFASEAEVLKFCDSQIKQISGKSAVVRFSQANSTTQTPGIPDRRYRPFGVCVWFEAKSEKPDAQLTREQFDFLTSELAAGELAACGTTRELVQVLDALRGELFGTFADGHALAVCAGIVQDWQGRGFRGEKKPPKPKQGTQ